MSEKRYAMFLAVMVAELPQGVSVRHIALDEQVDANLAEVFADGLKTLGIVGGVRPMWATSLEQVQAELETATDGWRETFLDALRNTQLGAKGVPRD